MIEAFYQELRHCGLLAVLLITQIRRSTAHWRFSSKATQTCTQQKLNIRHKYLLKIQVTDNFGLTAETKIEASVEDVNDHAPVFAKVINHFHEIFIHADLI